MHSEKRRSTIEKARQVWIRQLIDLSRRNNLLYYRPLKSGTLDLSLAVGDLALRGHDQRRAEFCL